MTEQQEWHTADPPWLATLHPDLGDDDQEPTPEQRAARLVEQLERAAAGRVPPALAGPGWGEAAVAEYTDEPTKTVPRQPTVGPWPCQQPEPLPCPDCDRTFLTKLALTVHTADHRQQERPRQDHRDGRRGTTGAVKPKPGARKTKSRRHRR